MNRIYNTEIISVGTELLLGHITNTDARDVSEALAGIGINVLYHTVVGDNPGRLEKCIEIAKQRADIIIATGGLGPTCDDLTKDTLAKAFGLELKRNEEEYKALYDYISARHKTHAGRLPDVPLKRTARSSSCCLARPKSAGPCSKRAWCPI